MRYLCNLQDVKPNPAFYLMVNLLQRALRTFRGRADCPGIALNKCPRWVHVKPAGIWVRVNGCGTPRAFPPDPQHSPEISAWLRAEEEQGLLRSSSLSADSGHSSWQPLTASSLLRGLLRLLQQQVSPPGMQTRQPRFEERQSHLQTHSGLIS